MDTRLKRTSSSETWHSMVRPAELHLSTVLPVSVLQYVTGAVAVVEGVGEHGCEYMTGGCKMKRFKRTCHKNDLSAI